MPRWWSKNSAAVVLESFVCRQARAIPLVLAPEEQPAVVTKLFNDERSAAFWAQGAAKGGVLPCLICTSGTAAANYLPAVVESSLAGTPMLVLTTDRLIRTALCQGQSNATPDDFL